MRVEPADGNKSMILGNLESENDVHTEKTLRNVISDIWKACSFFSPPVILCFNPFHPIIYMYHFLIFFSCAAKIQSRTNDSLTFF